MNQKLRFLCFRCIHNSLPSFWAKLGYSRIKIDHIADSLPKLQIEIGVHLINVKLSQLLTLAGADIISLAVILIAVRQIKAQALSWLIFLQNHCLSKAKLWNQVPSLDHFVAQNSGDFLCWKYKEVVCFYVSNLLQ